MHEIRVVTVWMTKGLSHAHGYIFLLLANLKKKVLKQQLMKNQICAISNLACRTDNNFCMFICSTRSTLASTNFTKGEKM